MVKHLFTMWETQFQSLGWEDILEKEMATHSSIFAWKIPWTEKPGRLQSMESQRIGHNWATSFSLLLEHSGSVVIQSLSHVRLFETPWTATSQASLSLTISWGLLKLMSIESVKPSNHLILYRPLLLLPLIFSSVRDFSNELALCIMWSKYWNANFSVIPSKENSGLISIRIDWFDLLAVQETLKGFLQHHSSKVSIAQWSAFFMVQFSSIQDYWKNHNFD